MKQHHPDTSGAAHPAGAAALNDGRHAILPEINGKQPDVHTRHAKLPAGFIRNRGKGCPFPDRTPVELMIRTTQGLGSSGRTPCHAHDWTIKPSAIGGIVGYRRIVIAAPDQPQRPQFE